jgi:hypothetical protein
VFPKVFFHENAITELINNSIKNVISNFISTSFDHYSKEYATEYSGEGFGSHLGVISTRYEILENSENRFSCILYLTATFGGGNNWQPYAESVVVDKKAKKIIDSEYMKNMLPPLKEINRCANNYFLSNQGNREYPLTATINPDDLERSNSIIAKDTLFLLAPIFPGGGSHAEYQVYKIPIKKVGK